MGMTLKLKNLSADHLVAHRKTGKTCSGCDPDVPGHTSRATCPQCKGTGREGLSMEYAFAEIAQSREDETKQAVVRGRGMRRMDTEDADLYLEY